MRINSPTEFKQIIGRGTRINEDYGKLYFTIMDFRQATRAFADPDFDGAPVQVYEPQSDETVVPPDEVTPPAANEDPGPYGPDDVIVDPFDETSPTKPKRYVVDDVEVRVATERVQYLDASGRLITESLQDYSRKTVRKAYASLHDFLSAWSAADRKQAIVDELIVKGVFLDDLAAQVGRDLDPFDLICHIAFDQPPLTRRERAERVRKRNVFARHGAKARAVLEALLNKYADSGLRSVESLDILKVDPITGFGTPVEILKLFGGKPGYVAAISELETALYHPAA